MRTPPSFDGPEMSSHMPRALGGLTLPLNANQRSQRESVGFLVRRHAWEGQAVSARRHVEGAALDSSGDRPPIEVPIQTGAYDVFRQAVVDADEAAGGWSRVKRIVDRR